ncbi:hypothetical protein GJ496_009126 [Pomphorhynchus laevis]|nr:hypothetical protein GJ496_009126 [Pomphorhynchus laevis]
MSLNAAILNPKTKHTGTLIFLHGLGDNGKGWCETFTTIQRPNIKYIFPHSACRKVSLNFGMEMPAWFDIRDLTGEKEEDEAGILESVQYLHNLIANEVKLGIPSENIMIGGFSMGGALSMLAGIMSKIKLAGVIALSSWSLLHSRLPQLIGNKEYLRDLNILQCHGTSDMIVDFKYAKKSSELMHSLGCQKYKFIEYDNIGHESSLEVMREVERFIKQWLVE